MCNLIPGVGMMVLVVSAVHSILDCWSFWVEKARSRHFLGIPMHFRMGVYIEKRDVLPSLAVAVGHYSMRCQISCFWGMSMCPCRVHRLTQPARKSFSRGWEGLAFYKELEIEK